jgi:hypothetical protein
MLVFLRRLVAGGESPQVRSIFVMPIISGARQFWRHSTMIGTFVTARPGRGSAQKKRKIKNSDEAIKTNRRDKKKRHDSFTIDKEVLVSISGYGYGKIFVHQTCDNL